MKPDLRIHWDDVCADPNDFERLVKLLLQRLYPEGEVLDGRGGDGGREFQVYSDGALTLYEAKSFTGRVSAKNPDRRGQVIRSLISAGRHQPDSWNLVVPIDHNTTERAWFHGLKTEFPYIRWWHGATWLEEQLADHDDLVRYATQNRLLEYVRHYKLEIEALTGGVPDLVGRHRALAELGDSLSPDWRPVVRDNPNGPAAVTLTPKHPEAALTAPITLSFTLIAADDPEGAELREQLSEYHHFGTGVKIPGRLVADLTVNSPPELGLAGRRDALEDMEICERPETGQLPHQTLAVHEPNGAIPVAALAFEAEKATRGPAGGIRLHAFDPTRMVKLVTDVLPDGTMTVQIEGEPVHPILPSAALPGLRLLRALTPGNTLVLTSTRDDITDTQISEVPPEFTAFDRLSRHAVQFVENLAVIQERLHQTFPLPAEATAAEVRWSARLRQLVEGHEVRWSRGPVTVGLDPARVGDFKAQFTRQPRLLRICLEDSVVHFGRHAVHTGPLHLVGTVAVDLDAIPDEPTPDVPLEAVFTCLGDGWFRARQGSPTDEQPS